MLERAETTAFVVASPKNLFNATLRGLTMRGFLTRMFAQEQELCCSDIEHWIQQGLIAQRETVYTGIDSTAEAIVAMLFGQNIGKMIVDL